MSIYEQPIIILDFGSQYTQLIARKIREVGVYSLIKPYDISKEEIQSLNPIGVVLSGGPESAKDADSPKLADHILDLNCPILGICYGMQILACKFSGDVESAKSCEFGHALLQIKAPSALFEDITLSSEEEQSVWMSHGDHVSILPKGFKLLASTESVENAAIFNEDKKIYAVQFHPEVTHTKHGEKILENFVINICGAKNNWNASSIIEESIIDIKNKVGKDEKVILALSGGVDSAVCAGLLHKAIGNNLICIFVDNGLLRLNESEQVYKTFKQELDINLIKVNAKDRFLNSLSGVTDPEQKRKIIGNLFIEIFQEQAENLNGIKWLAQGTIYPDVIESAGNDKSKAKVIKSHHNVGGLPDVMSLKLIEPLRNLFKDEVRKVGLELGIPKKIINRHPFPGPGLAVRILGEVKQEYINILQQVDNIFLNLLEKYNFYNKTAQAFAVFLPVKSVGVKGDARAYEYVVSLRAVETTDFMTAHFAKLPFELLEEASTTILNKVQGVSRVCYDISSKPPATIEWE